MKTSDFRYELPEKLIAQHPLPGRTDSRMLVLHRNRDVIEHRFFSDLPCFLGQGDLLVVNDTRVFPARLFGRKPTGGLVELLLLEESEPGIWRSLVRASRPVREGTTLVMGSGKIKAEVIGREPDGSIRVRMESPEPILGVLEEEGHVPLPPYIRRDSSACVGRDRDDVISISDRDRYQTVYASSVGAVAAPTAGLHFSTDMLEKLGSMGVERVGLTLHVGPGTFRPVKTETVEEHVMDSERYEVTEAAASAVNRTIESRGRVVAVGSTVTRTLEHVAAQSGGRIVPGSSRTDLFIYPPYEFRAVDVLLTNFHLPGSTLIMMVCALAGHDLVMRAYREAVAREYRFFSYGDCMLIL